MASGFDRLVEKRRKPPRMHAPSYLIPGYGDVELTSSAKDYYDNYPNEGVPQPRYGSQRAPYNKNDRFKLKHPYRTARGDASRPHRPRLN